MGLAASSLQSPDPLPSCLPFSISGAFFGQLLFARPRGAGDTRGAVPAPQGLRDSEEDGDLTNAMLPAYVRSTGS